MESAERTTAERYAQFINPALAKLFRLMGLSAVERRAKGVYIFDQDGQAYLDCLGGYGVFNLGHAHEEVVAAVRYQLEDMPLSGKLFLNDQMAEAAERLADILPGDLCYSFFVNSGTEAVEGALKLARLHTGRSKIIAMRNGFHGKTFGALSATGREVFRAPFKPLVPGFLHADFNDIASLERLLDEETAAVIVEPVQGEGGIIVPDDGYLAAVKRLCERWGCLLICDEVQTGLGRTGKLFASAHDGVTPDLMVTAKALGGGVMPVGAFSGNAAVWERFVEHPFLHTSTFGGNPLACAAVAATIRVLQRDYASFQVAEKGAALLEGLAALRAKHPNLIVAVRGRGLMIGIALRTEGLGGFFMAECVRRHILIAYTLNNPQVIRLEPPFLISFAHVRQILSAFGEIMAAAEFAFAEG